MKKILIIGCALAMGIMAGCQPQPSNPEAEKAATVAAEQWLQLTDNEKYEESWAEAATYFKNAVPKEKWIEQMKGFRTPLEEVESRTLRKAQYSTSLPGAPDGQYVIVQFETVFANKKQAVENVTPMKEADGSWKVSGYYIR